MAGAAWKATNVRFMSFAPERASNRCAILFFMREESAYSLLLRGRRLFEVGNPAQAALVLEKARSVEPNKGSILELLGRAYFQYGSYNSASSSFEDALEVDPTNDYAHYCLGLCYLKLRRKDDAGVHFKLAWFLKPAGAYRRKALRYGVGL